MSHGKVGHFSEMGGKCPLVIHSTFMKWEENVPMPLKAALTKVSEMGGNYPHTAHI